MAIMSAAINKCYRYGRIVCQFLHFLLIALLKSDTHVREAQLIAGSIMRSTRTFVITVSNDRVSCPAHLEEKLHTAVIVTREHGCLTAAGHCYVMLGTIKFVDKSVNDNSVRRLDHCDVIASRSGFGVPTGVPHSEVETPDWCLSHLQQLIWDQTQINTRTEHSGAHASNQAGQFMPLI